MPPTAEWVEEMVADPVLLFRFSAVTGNAHRIHYDHPYATGVEGYPDLVVHGPLTALLLAELARRRSGTPATAISFRARAPHFANRRFWLTGSPADRWGRPRRGPGRPYGGDDAGEAPGSEVSAEWSVAYGVCS